MAAGLTRGASKALTQLAKKLFRDAEKTGKIDRTLLDELDLLPVAEGKGTSKMIPEFEWRADPGYEMARDKKGNILNPAAFGKVIQKIPTEKQKVGIMTPSTKISRKVINYLLKEDSEVGKDFLKLKTQNLIKGTDNFIRDGSLRKDAIQELLNQASIQNSPRMTKFLKPFLEKGEKAAKRRSKLSEVLFSKDMNLFEKSLDDPWLLLSDDMKKFTDVMAKAEPERAGPNLKAARLAARKEEEIAGLQRMLEDPEFRAEYEAGTLDPTTMRLIDKITKRGQREFARETEVYGKPYDPKRTEYDESIDLWKKREDIWKVVSQPINSETSIWLQELLSSPLAWMEVEITDSVDLSRYGYRNQLIAINIEPGSYEVYNTENNLHYIEFSFSLASQRTQQRG